MASRRASVVVGIAILVSLCLLLLSAITQMKESAASMSCRNNLRQLGLALDNHRSSCDGKLPPLVDVGEGARFGRGLPSAFATLVPFLESTPLIFRHGDPATRYHSHSSVTFEVPNKSGGKFTEFGGMANQSLRMFLDPADITAHKRRDVPMSLPDGCVGYYATGSYAANSLLPWGTDKRFGLCSATVVFSEKPQVCRTAEGNEVFNLWGLGFQSPHMPAFNPASPAEFQTPFQLIRTGVPCDPRLPGTPHRNGMHAAMADGSTRVFAHGTTPQVFWDACVPELQ